MGTPSNASYAAAAAPAALLPPQAVEAEAAVLGSCLLDNRCIMDVATRLSRADFYLPAHQSIFAAILALSDEGKPVDILLLADALRDSKQLARVGGPDALVAIIEGVPSAARAEYYAERVQAASLRRRLLGACQAVSAAAHDMSLDTDEMLDTAQAEIFAVSQSDSMAEAARVGDLLEGIFRDVESAEHDRITGVRTHFAELDDLTCGLQPGELSIVAGRPSMGKTTFALNIAGRVAMGDYNRPDPEGRRPVLIFSLEMSKPVIARNILCGYAKVDAHRLRRGLLRKEEVQELTVRAGDLYEAPIYIDDTPGLSLRDLRTRARRLKLSVPALSLVIVDYLQLMEERRAENRTQEISIISRGLKALARELEVPVVALSQLSRGVESREGNEPRMSDLRESGSIEQDADVIMLLFRPEYYSPGTRPGEADIIVAKQRNGPTGRFPLTFMRQFLRFENYLRPEQGFQ
ncbi:replicative DNA helicase [bacterium]|nr:replicative DNA helicase [bacterium]